MRMYSAAVCFVTMLFSGSAATADPIVITAGDGSIFSTGEFSGLR